MDDSRRCQAHSSRTGERCKKAAVLGTTVCATHGASAGQVKAAARRRLAELIDPAIDALHRAAESKDMRAVVQAARAILDRAGVPATTALEIDERERELTVAQAEQLARILRRAVGALGIPPDDPAIRKVIRAAILAEDGDEWHRPEGVGVVSEDTAKVMLAELRQEPPPLLLVAAPESEDADPDGAEEVAL